MLILFIRSNYYLCSVMYFTGTLVVVAGLHNGSSFKGLLWIFNTGFRVLECYFFVA